MSLLTTPGLLTPKFLRPKGNWLGQGAVEVNNTLSQILLADGNTVAWYRPGVGVTGALNASAWADQSGNGNNLLQATGANQPIYLPFTGAKYLYLPAVASNTVTTPTKTITGNMTHTFDVALNDYTPAADVTLYAKTSGNDGFSVKWLTTDKIRLVIGDGASLTNVDLADATGFADGSQNTCTIAWTDGVGASFTLNGGAPSATAAVKTLTNAAVDLTIGSATSIGKLYDLLITNGASTTYYHMDPDESSETATNAATWTSSNGEVYTLNNTGTKLAQIVGSPSLLFDGPNHTLLTDVFVQAQSFTWYFVGTQITWTNNATIIGDRTNDLGLIQYGVTPNVGLGNIITEPIITGFTLGTKAIITSVWDGASSLIQLNDDASTTGNPGAAAMAKFSVAARAGNIAGNIQVNEIIIRSGTDSAATRLAIQIALARKHGITL